MAKTLRVCEAESCRNVSRNCNLSFFSFPKNSADRLQKFCGSIQMKVSDRKERFICSDHFEMTAFTNTFKRRLLPGAVPTIQQLSEWKKHAKEELHIAKSPVSCSVDVAETNSPSHSATSSSMIMEIGSKGKENHQTPSTSHSSMIIYSTPKHQKPENESTKPSVFQSTPKTRKINKYKTALYRSKRKILFNRAPRFTPKQLILQHLKAVLQPTLFNIVAAQLKNSGLPVKGRRWTANDKAFAFNIYLASPSAYRVLRKFLSLPTIRTLHRSIQGVGQISGFSQQIFNVLKQKVAKLKAEEKQCVVAVDEMAIRSSLQYLSSRDCLTGYQDASSVRSDGTAHIATHALVFMARGIQSNWKQVLGYFFVTYSMPGEPLKTVVMQCISKLQDVGLKVIALVSDQGSNNIKMFSELGLTEENTSFSVNDESVWFFYDPPHLLKSLRNNMMNYEIKYDDSKSATWKYIYDFFVIDSKQQLRTVPKLTKNHVCPVGRNKMKVKYASQALSHSVAASIYLLTSVGVFPGEASETADFVLQMDKLFDSFNSRCSIAKKELLSAFKKDSSHLSFWNEMIGFVKSWEFLNQNGKKVHVHCKKGWLVSLRSAIGVCSALIQQQEFILMRRFNQDPLENTFSVIRSKRGNDSNPDCSQFISSLRAIMVNDFFRSSSQANCEDDFDEVLLSLKDKCSVSSSLLTQNSSLFENEETVDDPFLASELPNADSTAENVLFYITGYIAKKILAQLNFCTLCEEQLVDTKCDSVFESKTLLTQFKDFTGGSLKYPSNDLYDFVCSLRKIKVEHFYIQNGVLQKMQNTFIQNCDSNFLNTIHDGHKDSVKRLVILLFSKILLFSHIRKVNRELKEKTECRSRK